MMASTARRFFSVESICVDPVKECEFFSSLKRRNRTFKLMQPSRFAGLEAEIGSLIGGDGALFELGPDGKFNVKVRVGKGSEVEQLILANKTCAAGSTS